MKTMTEHDQRPPRASLFAAKGAAAPSPAVGYVSVRQLEGKPGRGGLPSPLAALINRRIDAQASTTVAPRGAPDDARRQPPLAARPAPANRRTVIDPRRVLSTPGGYSGGRSGRHGASPPVAKRPDVRELPNPSRLAPSPANPNAPWAKPDRTLAIAPLAPARRAASATRRKPLTVRLELAQYARLKDRVASAGATFQSILAGAVAAYLEASA